MTNALEDLFRSSSNLAQFENTDQTPNRQRTIGLGNTEHSGRNVAFGGFVEHCRVARQVQPPVPKAAKQMDAIGC